MSKILTALFVAATTIALSPDTSANGWNCWKGGWKNWKGGWGGGWDNDCNDKDWKHDKKDKDCKDKDDKKDCKNKHHGKHCKKSCKKKNDCNNNNTPPPICDAGGPYEISSLAPFATVELDGRDSTNETSYLWTTQYPGATFDDPTSATPTLTIPAGGCNFNLTVYLTVSNKKGSSTCNASVRLRDVEPPVLTCPDLAKVFCGDDESPAATGEATATDNCDQDVSVAFQDTTTYSTCPAQRFERVIQRRWKARDDEGNFSECIQTIDVLKQLTFLDVMPGVAPNVYDPAAADLVPMAIVGQPNVIAGNIQWNTVKLYGRDCVGGPVTPMTLQLSDVTGPYYANAECDSGVVAPDGTLDLVAYFHRGALNQAFGLANAPSGTVVSVVMTGKLADDCRFVATDCLVRL